MERSGQVDTESYSRTTLVDCFVTYVEGTGDARGSSRSCNVL